jgi:hypothetical protein
MADAKGAPAGGGEVALVKAELRQLRADHNRNFKIFR